MKFEYISPKTNKQIVMEYDEYFTPKKVEERKKTFDFLLSSRDSWEFMDTIDDELGDFQLYEFYDEDKKYHDTMILTHIILMKNDIICGYVGLSVGRVMDYNIDLPYQYQGFMIHMLSIYSKKYDIEINLPLFDMKMKNIFLQLGYSRSTFLYVTKYPRYFQLTSENAAWLLRSYNSWIIKKYDNTTDQYKTDYRSFFTSSIKLMKEWITYGVFNP